MSLNTHGLKSSKTILSNGTIICATFKENFHGKSYMDIYARSADGHHIASRTFIYGTLEQKTKKLQKVLGEIKLEIVSYEAGTVAKNTNDNIEKILSFINIRCKELNIQTEISLS